nr:MAG TPA: hypothetical protein [Bacteriophage sp.]
MGAGSMILAATGASSFGRRQSNLRNITCPR